MGPVSNSRSLDLQSDSHLLLDTLSIALQDPVQLSKANTFDTEAAFLDMHLSISYVIVSTKIYDKRDDFDFEIVNFSFLDGDVPRSTSYGIYTSQPFRFARAFSYVTDFTTHNKLLTQKLINKAIGIINLTKPF